MSKVRIVWLILCLVALPLFAGDEIKAISSLGQNVMPVLSNTYWSGTNWVVDNNMAKHTAGATTALTATTPKLEPGKKYLLEYTVAHLTAGAITVAISGATDTARTANGSYAAVITASERSVMTITPDTNFNGAVTAMSVRPYVGGTIYADQGIESAGTLKVAGNTTILGSLTTTGAVTGPVAQQLTYEYWVDGNRTDTYTATGSMLYPFLTIKEALDVINTKVAASPRGSYVVHVAPGTYSTALAITGGPQYLRIEGFGVVISGAITYTPANDVYDKVEFVGAATGRSSKGPAMTISGKINLVKSNDSLKYVGFQGVYVTGEIEAATNGTWVLEFKDCYVTGAIDGTLASFAGAQVPSILIETYGYNKFTGAMSGVVSLYNCWDTEFACNMTNTPYFENRFNNCRFTAGTISIIPKSPASSSVIYGDANSLTSFKARTPTVTGATYSNIDACGMLADAQTWSGVQTAGIRQPTSIYNADGSETLDATMSGKTVVCTKGDGTTTITIPNPDATTVGVVYEVVQTADRQVDVVCTTADSNGIVADGVATSDKVSLATASHLIGGGMRVIGIQTAAATYKWFVTAMSPTEPLTVEAAD